MARLQPSIVQMSVEDVPSIARLWIDHRAEDANAGEAARRVVEDGRFAAAVDRDDVVILVAGVQGEVVGYAWISTRPVTAQIDVQSVTIEDLYVVPEARDQGVGRALLTAVTGYAHKRDIDIVACSLPTHAKDANRTMARLGFAGVATRRVAQTSSLMRRLRGPEPRGGIDQLLIQRRRRAQRAAVPERLVAQS